MEGSSLNLFIVSLVIFLTLAHFPNTGSAARALAGTTNTEFIKSSCSATTYPKLCFTSLSSQATIIRSDPKLLTHAALSVSLETARSTSAKMVNLSKSQRMTPREVSAMRDCIEELSDSVDQLRHSMAEMTQLRASNFDLIMNDIETWVSAALTDDDTCTDGFSGKAINANTRIAVRARILNIAHMTSNALALVNSYASLHS